MADPGWYPSPQQPGMQQWYDGTEWQPRFQPTDAAKTAEASRFVAVVLILVIGVVVAAAAWYLLNKASCGQTC